MTPLLLLPLSLLAANPALDQSAKDQGVDDPQLDDQHLDDQHLDDRWITITGNEKKAGPQLINTTELSGLTPGLFISVEGAYRSQDEALAACAAFKAVAKSRSAPSKCYAKRAGRRYKPWTLEQAKAHAGKHNGRVIVSELVRLRGRDVPVVALASGSWGDKCDHGGGAAELFLYWGAKPIGLGAIKPGQNICCEATKRREAPAGLVAFATRCRSTSCGGACQDDTWLTLVPEDNMSAAVTRRVRCTENLAANAWAEATTTCDKATLTRKKLSLRFDEVKVDECKEPAPDDAPGGGLASKRTTTLRYAKRKLVTQRGRWAPHARDYLNCGDPEDGSE